MMFELFIGNKKGPDKDMIREKIANTIVSRSIRLQDQWASFMQRLTEKLSINSKKSVTILFCLLAGCYNLFTIIESFSAKKKNLIAVINIKTPKHLTHNGEENIHPATINPATEFKTIQNFRAYLDSLKLSAKGRIVADSILRMRPGLQDSIIQLKQLFHLQDTSKK
ncbi:MAG: hypothetical protein H7Z13_02160 [Ferruginibacter sp.]|nr:hypothetical protein [Ferruginibacter sp.]